MNVNNVLLINLAGLLFCGLDNIYQFICAKVVID